MGIGEREAEHRGSYHQRRQPERVRAVERGLGRPGRRRRERGEVETSTGEEGARVARRVEPDARLGRGQLVVEPERVVGVDAEREFRGQAVDDDRAI